MSEAARMSFVRSSEPAHGPDSSVRLPTTAEFRVSGEESFIHLPHATSLCLQRAGNQLPSRTKGQSDQPVTDPQDKMNYRNSDYADPGQPFETSTRRYRTGSATNRGIFRVVFA